MEPHEASALLGLAPDADAATVRRRFRELARELHPDRGGDPVAFAAVRLASDLLLADAEDADAGRAPAGSPVARGVARGRPSRAVPPAAVDPPDGDAAVLARMLDGRGPDRAGRVVLRLVSAAPGARRNRFATALPASAVAVLELRIARSGQDAPAPAVRLSARGRAARRRVTALRLDAPALGGAWTRHRADGAVELRADPRPAGRAGDHVDDGGAGDDGAMAAGLATAGLLRVLRWPLREWTEDRPPAVRPPPQSVARRAVSDL